MPARKGSIEGNFITKAVNYIKPYIKPAILVTGLIGVAYLQKGCETHAWTPKQMIEYSKREQERILIEKEHKKQIDADYHKLYNNCKDFEDSVKVALENDFPIRLIEPSDSLKEKAVNQSKLEGKLWEN